MRKLTVASIAAVALLGALGTPSAGAKPPPVYTLTDVGTLGVTALAAQFARTGSMST